MRNTLEDSGSKDLPQERVPLDRNLPASERSVMPRAQNNLSRRLQTHHQTHPEHSSPWIPGLSSFSNRKISRSTHTHYAVRSSWKYTANRSGAR